ncbi:MAG: sugar phosphate isomerase/epimerase [Candidatus Latescibacteria bacterium]|nr:sugar phosphate isomerase/epimerase [Candidatus Latescibacterota bacterium]
MYASIRDGSLLHAGYRTIAEGLHDLGLSAVELDVNRQCAVNALTLPGATFSLTSETSRKHLKTHLEENSVRVSAFLLANNFNADDLDREVDWCAQAINAAGDLGIQAVRIDSAMRGERELSLHTRIERFIGGITRVLDATGSSGVALGIENHGSCSNDRRFLDAVLDGVNSSRLGLTMDTGNFYWYGYPLDEVYEILEHFAPKAKHTHVKNINFPEADRARQRDPGWKYGEYVCPIPDGDIDVGRVVGFLKAAGYDGDLCIEDESLGRFSEPERRQVLRRDVECVKRLVVGGR